MDEDDKGWVSKVFAIVSLYKLYIVEVDSFVLRLAFKSVSFAE